MSPAAFLVAGTSVVGADGADAVFVRDGRIAAVGRAAELARPGLPGERFEGVIAAGFCDAHMHPVGYAALLQRPALKDAKDFDDLVSILAVAAAGQPPGTAVVGMRLDDETLAEGRLPDRRVLDRAVPDRPALAIRYCGHITVANTAALQRAGIGPDTPDPEGGIIDRDEHGVPTGVLRETAADAVSGALRGQAPPLTGEGLLRALTALASLGLTSVGGIVDVGEGLWPGGGPELDSLIEAGPHLPIRVGALVIARTVGQLEEAAGRLAGAGPNLRFLGFKAFADGSLGGHTAAMHEPYTDRPGTRGTHRLDPEWAHTMATAALRLGGRVAIHAIGDSANERVLDVMERLIADGADPAMLRIEHASVLTERDLDRFARLGVTAAVQPAFLASEAAWLSGRVGPKRIRFTYAFRSLVEAGVPLAGSSDCPVEPPHPLWGMAAARDRCGLAPEERLDAGDAYRLFTDWSAAAIGESRSIEPGATADLVVLDRHPVDTPPEGLREAKVLATYVEGDRVDVGSVDRTWPG